MLHWAGRAALAAVLTLLFAGVVNARALHLGGFDLDRGGAESLASADLAELSADIQRAFPGTEFILKSKITAKLTAKLDVILLGVRGGSGSAIVPLSRKEQRALKNFAMAGGTVLIFADNDSFDVNAPAANASLLAPFGLVESGTLAGEQYVKLAKDQADPIADGPFGSIGSFIAFSPGWFSTLGQAVALGKLGQNKQFALAYLPAGVLGSGSGAVVLFADSTILFDSMRSTHGTVAILNALALTP